MAFLAPLIPEIPAAGAAVVGGLTAAGAALSNPDVQKGIANAVNGAGAGATDLLRGIGENFSHGAGNSSYHTSRGNSAAVPLKKPIVLDHPAVSIPRGGTSSGIPAHTTTARGGTMTTPAHASSVKTGTMTTPAYVPGISGVTDLPDVASKATSLSGTKALANTDAAVAEATLPRLPKEEATRTKLNLPDISAPDVGELTVNQESADIGRASNFSRGANG